MTSHGQGHCTINYLAGWDDKGIDSQESCNKVCEDEENCTFASLKKDASCSRFGGSDCGLVVDSENAKCKECKEYFTFKKTVNGVYKKSYKI